MGSSIASTGDLNLSPELDIFDLADNDSALLFSALIVRICSLASAFADTGSMSPRSLSPVSQDSIPDDPFASRIMLWRNATCPPTGLVRHQVDGDASDQGRGSDSDMSDEERGPDRNAPTSGSTCGVGSNALVPRDTPGPNNDEDQRLAEKLDPRLLRWGPVALSHFCFSERHRRFTTGGNKRLYNGIASLTSWRMARRVWLLFRAEPSHSIEQWLLDYSRLYDELIQLPYFEELEGNVSALISATFGEDFRDSTDVFYECPTISVQYTRSSAGSMQQHTVRSTGGDVAAYFTAA